MGNIGNTGNTARRPPAAQPKADAKKQPLIRPFIIISAFLVVFTAMCFTLAKSVANLHSARQQEQRLLTQIEDARKLTDELMARKRFMQTDDYIEREARIEYGLSRPGTMRYAFDSFTYAHGDEVTAASSAQVDGYADAGI